MSLPPRILSVHLPEARRLHEWAVRDKFFSAGIRWLGDNVFSHPHAYHVRLESGEAAVGGGKHGKAAPPEAPTEGYFMRYHNERRFKTALERLMRDAQPWLHLFPVLVLRMRTDVGAWLTDLLVQTTSPTGGRDSIGLPVQVQPLDEREGRLDTIEDPRSGVRSYVWTPHDEQLGRHWTYLYYVHDLATCKLYPTLSVDGHDGEDDGAPVAFGPSSTGSSGESSSWPPSLLAPTGGHPRRGRQPFALGAGTASGGGGQARLPSLFRALYHMGERTRELEWYMLAAVSQNAVPTTWLVRRPLVDLVPEMPSAEALASTDTVEAAQRVDVFRAAASTMAAAGMLVDRAFDRTGMANGGGGPGQSIRDALRAQSGGLAPQEAVRTRFGRPHPVDSTVSLPELFGDVREQPASFAADLDLADDRYARHMARAFGSGLPADVLRGGADVMGHTGARTSRVATQAVTDHLEQGREEALARERNALNLLFQFVYRHALAQLDLEMLLATIDTFEHYEGAVQLGKVLAPRRQALADMVTGRTPPADPDEVEAASVLSKAKLRQLIVERLVTQEFLRATLIFDDETEAEARDALMREVEHLPPEVQEGRRADFDLVLKGAVAGVIGTEDVARQAKELLGLALPATRKLAKEHPSILEGQAAVDAGLVDRQAEADMAVVEKTAEVAPPPAAAGAGGKRKAGGPAKSKTGSPAKKARKD